MGLLRNLRTPDEVAQQLVARGLSEVVRLVRSGTEVDRDTLAMLPHRRTGPGSAAQA